MIVQLRAWRLDCGLQKWIEAVQGFSSSTVIILLRHGGDTVQDSSEIVSCVREDCIMNDCGNAAHVGTLALALPPASGKMIFMCSAVVTVPLLSPRPLYRMGEMLLSCPSDFSVPCCVNASFSLIPVCAHHSFVFPQQAQFTVVCDFWAAR